MKKAHALVLLAGLSLLPSQSWGTEPPLRGMFKDNFSLLDPPTPAPDTAFLRGDGSAIRLADFAGQAVLLNFWATWCAPCVREMPALDRLQARLGDAGLAVVAVSADRSGVKAVEPFFQRTGLSHLAVYLDSKGALARSLGITGLPTSLLIDPEGRVVGGLEGPAEWDSEDAVALIRHYLPGNAPATVIKTGG